MKGLLSILLLLVSTFALAQYKEDDGTVWYPHTMSKSTVLTVPDMINITMPVDSVRIIGRATTSTPGRRIYTYYWSQVTHRTPDRIKSPTNSTGGGSVVLSNDTADIVNLQKGYSIWRFWVSTSPTTRTEVDSIFYRDVRIVVNPPGATVINAGNDTTVWKNQRYDIGQEKFRLVGEHSKGGTSYKWSQLSGPNLASIQFASAATTEVTGLQLGDYRFLFTMTTATGILYDTVVCRFRDLQRKDQLPCRPGGGIKIIVPPTSSGFDTLANGTIETWNSWRDIAHLNAYLKGKALPQAMGGDTLLFQGADKTLFFRIMAGFSGSPGCPIVMQPKDRPVVVRGGGSRFAIGAWNTLYSNATPTIPNDTAVVSYVIVDGTSLRSKGYYYGWQHDQKELFTSTMTAADSLATLDSRGMPAFSGASLSNFTIKGFYSFGTTWIQIQRHAGIWGWWRWNKFEMRNINIYDSRIEYISEEGAYIGATDVTGSKPDNYRLYQPRMDTVRLMHNVFIRTGWDGIQVTGANNALIKYNVVIDAGFLNTPSQKAGILLGGASTGRIDSNFVFISRGSNFETFGRGKNYVRGNVGYYSRSGDGSSSIFQKTEATLPENELPNMTPYVVGNVLQQWEDKAIEQLGTNYVPGGRIDSNKLVTTGTLAAAMLVGNGVTVPNTNTTTAAFPISVATVPLPSGTTGHAITVTQGGTTRTFTNDVDGLITWLQSRAFGVTLNEPAYVEGEPEGATAPPVLNAPPVVNAGADKIIQLPVTSVNLTGSATDGDGSVTGYTWSVVSVPAGAIAPVFSSTTNTAISVSSLNTVGTYTFRLTAKDDDNAPGSDDVAVTVNPANNTGGNVPPVAMPGADKSVVLPANAVSLVGGGTDADGSVVSYQWAVVSGPSDPVLTAPTAATTSAQLLGEGVYVFSLTVRDNNEATDTKTVTVTVSPAPAVKQTGGEKFFITRPDRRRVFINQ